MKIPSRKTLFIFLALLIEAGLVSGILIASVNQYFPNIGIDFKYFIPRLIDSFLHYQINGFSIQWYTPSFGGGMPSYPNPQQIQFSIPQLFTQFTNPYTAILISIFVFCWVGIVSSYYLFKSVLGFGTTASLLSGVLFLANGFYIQHMGIGHLTFITLPVLPLLLIGILRRGNVLFNGVIIGCVFATLLHHGSFYLVIYFTLSTALSLALIGVIKPIKLKLARVFYNSVTGLIFAVTLSASKLGAVLHFLRLFPRHITDEFDASLGQALFSVPLQLFGAMSLRPIGFLQGTKPKLIWDAMMTYTGSQLSFWELDISVTPIIWVLLGISGAKIFQLTVKRRINFTKYQWLSLIVTVFFFELIIEFIIAKGLFYPVISQAPILNSLHVNPRYTLTLIFPLVILAIASYDYFTSAILKRPKAEWLIFGITLFLALAPLSVYFEMPMDKLGRRQFYVEGSVEVYQRARQGETFPVKQVVADMNDARVFDQFASNLTPYEVLFGYNLGEFNHTLVEGSPYLTIDETYNFNNPSALVFPEANDARPFDRIRVSERENLDALLNRRQPNWNLPPRQLFADRVSILAALVSVVVLLKHLFANKHREEEV